MSLKCKECGSRDTTIVTRKQLSKALDKPEGSLGSAGLVVDPVMVINAILALIALASQALNYLKEKEKNEVEYVICKDCGYYEKL